MDPCDLRHPNAKGKNFDCYCLDNIKVQRKSRAWSFQCSVYCDIETVLLLYKLLLCEFDYWIMICGQPESMTIGGRNPVRPKRYMTMEVAPCWAIKLPEGCTRLARSCNKIIEFIWNFVAIRDHMCASCNSTNRLTNKFKSLHSQAILSTQKHTVSMCCYNSICGRIFSTTTKP